MTAHDKLVQYINEAHALETTLVQTLTAHIAITPQGPYRGLLERHLGETREHAQALERRLGEIGAGRSPITQGLGLLEAAAGQALALGKAPLDMLRGTGGEEKLLKNAKDEAASEALEITTYDGLEALATALGDEVTAALARAHREQEEAMLAELRALIPSLTVAVVAADVVGIETYDPSTTGAADAVRDVARRTTSQARKAQRTAAKGVREAAEEAGEAAEDVERRAARGQTRTSGPRPPRPSAGPRSQ